MMQSENNQCIDRLEILSTQRKFYTEKKFSDVKIQIGLEVISASRIVLASLSEFFERMFCSDFKENNSDVNTPIVLNEVDVSAFKDILDAMFTGNIHVSDSNVLALLKASDYLQLRSLYVEDKCYEYLVSNSSKVVSEAFDILTFAHLTKRNRFIDLLNAHIIQHLSHFSNNVHFLEIPFEALVGLLKYRGGNDIRLANPQFHKRGDALLKLVTCWVNHDRKKRNTHRSELMKMIDLSNVSTKYALFLLSECENFIDKTVGHHKVNVDELLPNLKTLYIARPELKVEIRLNSFLESKLQLWQQLRDDKERGRG